MQLGGDGNGGPAPPPRPRRRPLQSFLIALNRSSASAAKQGGGAAGGGALVRRGAHFAATVGGVNRVNRVREMKREVLSLNFRLEPPGEWGCPSLQRGKWGARV